jgi:Txe/YoeB family toxin of Txe-Axe toxin-antitoxin module
MSDMERRRRDVGVAEGEDRRRGPDTLRSNPEVMERGDPQSVRSNPEVMGRTEPQTMPAPRQGEISSEMSDMRTRFDELQAEFIDDPKSAVKKAEKLMEDMFNKMRERMQSTHRDVEKTDDTEKLRLAMRTYRDMIDSIAGRRSF